MPQHVTKPCRGTTWDSEAPSVGSISTLPRSTGCISCQSHPSSAGRSAKHRTAPGFLWHRASCRLKSAGVLGWRPGCQRSRMVGSGAPSIVYLFLSLQPDIHLFPNLLVLQMCAPLNPSFHTTIFSYPVTHEKLSFDSGNIIHLLQLYFCISTSSISGGAKLSSLLSALLSSFSSARKGFLCLQGTGSVKIIYFSAPLICSTPSSKGPICQRS